jgi:hypothetical protein
MYNYICLCDTSLADPIDATYIDELSYVYHRDSFRYVPHPPKTNLCLCEVSSVSSISLCTYRQV